MGTAPLAPSRLAHPISSPPAGFQAIYNNPRISASTIVEFIASRPTASSAIYVYDLAEQVGFGTLTKEWAKSRNTSIPVFNLQTRAGAGLSLVGRLSEGTSYDVAKDSILTAYTTPVGLAAMTPSFAYLPPATPRSKLIIQVPTVVPVGETFTLSPSLASLATAFTLFPENIAVLLSSTPQQTVDFAAIAYSLTSDHIIHLFDHQSVSREFGHFIAPPRDEKTTGDLKDAITRAGYSFFEYTGDAEAHTVLILLNGPLALAAKAVTESIPGLGVVVVNVLRPWNEEDIRKLIPSTTQNIHVFDDVPNVVTQGSLYVLVFGSLCGFKSTFTVRAQRIVPSQAQEYLNTQRSFSNFLSGLLSSAAPSLGSFSHPKQKHLLLFSTPQSPLAALSHAVEDIFLNNKGISTRLLTDHDVFSKAGGITANRLLLTPKDETTQFVPIPFVIPFEDSGVADFLGILDPTLLTSHDLLKYAKPSCPVLFVTGWDGDDLLVNLPAGVVSLARERGVRLFTIDARGIATGLVGASGANDAIQNHVVHLAFLRFYLGPAASESAVLAIARRAFGEAVVKEQLPSRISAAAWSGLREVFLDTAIEGSNKRTLRNFEFNAITVEVESESMVNGARPGSWHDAAKHLLFPAPFAPPNRSHQAEDYPKNPLLRPEITDRTYLITCTVNRRLTPIEYDRNVFHLEFDTTGTGLKYAIGEALGVHGWNDEQEVIDFCAWYGVNPEKTITIPVATDEGTLHTRTVLQAVQQQIDIFGRPPKSFYTDLAPYATSSVDKHALLFIGSPEGSSTFKRLSEKDNITFVGVLKAYPSAKPPIVRLCELIGDIKPRHYSIASSQAVVGDRVDLLVVAVEWETSEGMRFMWFYIYLCT